MNQLKYKTEFEAALQNYHLSPSALGILHDTRLVLLNGPSAGGRNTIIKELLKTDNYHYIVSDTTRRPRTNDGVPEQDGVEYWFRDEASMLKDLQNGEFLEAEIIHDQQVSGISIRELAAANQDHRIAINDVEFGGIANVHELKPDAYTILILPPNFKTWQQRLLARGDMTSLEHRRRLETAVTIFKSALREDTFLIIVINHQFKEAAQQVNDLVQTGTVPDQIAGRELATQLLGDTEAYLQQPF